MICLGLMSSMKGIAVSEWFDAIERNDVERVSEIASSIVGRKISERNKKSKKQSMTGFGIQNNSGECAIHVAARIGNIEIVQLLIRHGCNVDERSSYDYTALMVALLSRQYETAQVLFDKGASLHFVDNKGKSILHRVCKNGDVKALKKLLEWNVVLDSKDVSNRTCLHEAAEFGHLDVVVMLLVQKMDITEEDLYGKMAIDLTTNHEIRACLGKVMDQVKKEEEAKKRSEEKIKKEEERQARINLGLEVEKQCHIDVDCYKAGEPMLESDNFFEILGVDNFYSGSKLKKAYYKLAMKYHTDKNPNADKDLWNKINHAYSILNDPEMKNAWIQRGDDGIEAIKTKRSVVTPVWDQNDFKDHLESHMEELNLNETSKFDYMDEALKKMNESISANSTPRMGKKHSQQPRKNLKSYKLTTLDMDACDSRLKENISKLSRNRKNKTNLTTKSQSFSDVDKLGLDSDSLVYNSLESLNNDGVNWNVNKTNPLFKANNDATPEAVDNSRESDSSSSEQEDLDEIFDHFDDDVGDLLDLDLDDIISVKDTNTTTTTTHLKNNSTATVDIDNHNHKQKPTPSVLGPVVLGKENNGVVSRSRSNSRVLGDRLNDNFNNCDLNRAGLVDSNSYTKSTTAQASVGSPKVNTRKTAEELFDNFLDIDIDFDAEF